MKEYINNIITKLLNHEISKEQALNELIITNAVNNIPNIQKSLNASVNAIYFNDSSDYLSAHYEVVRNLAMVEELDEDIIKNLFNKLNNFENE